MAGVTMCRVLGYGLLLAYAGAIANMLEWGSRGGVLDWLILPNGDDGVRGLSLGDTAIYVGVAWTAVMLVRHVTVCLREDVPALLRQRRRSG
jgi:lipoprotein signal peptidase